jgi:DNA-binding response OmpR family regulator
MPEKKPKVLLVDDETAITDNLSPFLERAGFEVHVAEDGEAALIRIADYSPDLLVLDVLMPHLDGREVLRRMRGSGNWTPVILLTQVGESSERAMALEEGADDYLNKPYLTPKALTLLDYLLTHPDELLSRERLLDVVWGWDYPVGTRAVDTRVAELRRALKDDPDHPTFIDTAPGHGYRFVGKVRPQNGG